MSRYRSLIKIILVYTVFVILWGAWVRISGSGDGCGESWPLCHGQVIPQGAGEKTWIELFHRMTSGLYGFVILYFVAASYKLFPKGHVCRKLAVLTLFFTVLEALIGARLVLAGLVGANASFDRGLIMALHLLNTFLLTGSLTLAYEMSWYQKPTWLKPTAHTRSWFAALAIAGFVVVGMSGAFAALSSTLYPSESLLSGLAEDFNSAAPLFVRLRAFHPMAAILFILGMYPLSLKWLAVLKEKGRVQSVPRAKVFLALLIFTGVAGLLNLLLLSPLTLKLIHLLLSQVLWISLLLILLALFTKEKELSHAQ